MRRPQRTEILARFIAAAILFTAGLLPGCDFEKERPAADSAADSNDRTYRFPTRNVSGFRQLIAEAPVDNAEGLGYLFLPVGASESNKVPLMIILHGSGGTWGGRGARHMEFLRRNGIGALLVDTFSSRGLDKKDKYVQRLMEANFPDQLADAFAALNALQDHPLVDGDRIGVMGYSMGGTSTILAAYENLASASSASDARFALHVAFYASCIIQPEERVPTGAPVIALWGTMDGATPKSSCDGFLDVFESAGVFVETRWYEGAAHGWNGNRPARYYEDIPNFAPCDFRIHANGLVSEAKTGKTTATDEEMVAVSEFCVSYGYTIGRHEKTSELANQELLDAIGQHLKPPG